MILTMRFRAVPLVLALAACTSPAASDRPVVVAAFYPLAEIVERVGGDAFTVIDLTPPGAEPHDLDLAPDDVATIADAALVVYVGGGFQPALEEALGERTGPSVDLSDGASDPHVWLDPARMVSMAATVSLELSRLDPAGADRFVQASTAYAAELSALAQRYLVGLAMCERRAIVVAHDSFGHLATRYDLTQHAIAGLSPETEPDAATLAQLTTLVERDGVTVVFTEPLVDASISRTLAAEAGVTTDVLDPIESLTREQIAAGESYVTVMDRNLAALRGALDCA